MSNRIYSKSFRGMSRTRQSDAQAADINHIMRNYLPGGVVRTGVYVDWSDPASVNLVDAYNKIMYGVDLFSTLPSKVRARFANDPGLLLEFLQDTANRDEAIKLGLIDAPKQDDNIDAPKQDNNADKKKGLV